MQTSHYTIDLDAGTIGTDQLPAGYSLRVKIKDDDSGACSPFDDSGHGETRHEWCSYGTPKLARGETILHSERGDHWIYNQGQAFVTAWRDGWGLSPDSLAKLTRRLGKKPTRSQIRAEAVRQDMRYLRGYLSSDWSYVGVCVTLHDAADTEVSSDSLWGIESNAGDYLLEVVAECANNCMHAADSHAEVFAENARDHSERFDAMQLEELNVELRTDELQKSIALRHRAKFGGKARVIEHIQQLREARETLASATAHYEKGE